MQFLREVSIFQDLSDNELLLFNNLFTLREVPAGEKIVAEGAPMHEFYVVCKGTVHVRRMSQKREMLLGRIDAGGFFGGITLFDQSTASASVYAMETVTLAVAEDAPLREFLEANPAIGYKVLRRLMIETASRLRQTDERFVRSMYWSSLNAPQRD